MKNAENAIEFIKWLQSGILEGAGKEGFTDPYQQGYFNGIESVLAHMEERPALFRDMNKQPIDWDVERFPEHFL